MVSLSLSIFFYLLPCGRVYAKDKIITDEARAFIGDLKVFCQSSLDPVLILVTNTPLFWLPHLWILSVPDECYSRNAPSALTLIFTFYSRSDIDIYYSKIAVYVDHVYQIEFEIKYSTDANRSA